MIPSFVVAAILTLGWIPLFIFRTESPTEAWPSYTADERLWVRLAPALIAVHMTAACTIISLTAPIPLGRAVAGVLLFAVGLAFWFWARTMISPLRVRRLPEQPPLEFHRHGAFGVVRNPLYLGILIAAAAPVVVTAHPLVVMTFTGCVVALVMRCLQDERRLHQQLGAPYAAYCRVVKRLIPLVW